MAVFSEELADAAYGNDCGLAGFGIPELRERSLYLVEEGGVFRPRGDDALGLAAF